MAMLLNFLFAIKIAHCVHLITWFKEISSFRCEIGYRNLRSDKRPLTMHPASPVPTRVVLYVTLRQRKDTLFCKSSSIFRGRIINCWKSGTQHVPERVQAGRPWPIRIFWYCMFIYTCVGMAFICSGTLPEWTDCFTGPMTSFLSHTDMKRSY